MSVLKIVPNIASESTEEAAAFYQELLGLDLVMDLGWIVTYSAAHTGKSQVSIATEGGSGSQVPDMSVEVDNVDEVHERAGSAGFDIVYPLSDEPWGVRRFYVKDPFGKILNILQHV